jgi:hypothetical protein
VIGSGQKDFTLWEISAHSMEGDRYVGHFLILEKRTPERAVHVYAKPLEKGKPTTLEAYDKMLKETRSPSWTECCRVVLTSAG